MIRLQIDLWLALPSLSRGDSVRRCRRLGHHEREFSEIGLCMFCERLKRQDDEGIPGQDR